MTDVRANTLFVTTEGAYLRARDLTLQVVVGGKPRISVPLHHLRAVAVLGHSSVSTAALARCAEAGIAVTFLTTSGRLIARVDAPSGGNVLLRREQFRIADAPGRALEIARSMVAGKLGNARAILLHAAREDPEAPRRRLDLLHAAARVNLAIAGTAQAVTLDELRGQEGIGARAYFGGFPHLVRQPGMKLLGRSRRPPRDPINAVLSFAYALLLNDCVGALTTAGLDPSVGFLHRDRPGRPGLALDLMEEFRPVLADRTVLALLNRRQLTLEHFESGPGRAVLLTSEGRKVIIAGYHSRAAETAVHPLLRESATLGEFPFIQSRLLARHIRGDLAAYPALLMR